MFKLSVNTIIKPLKMLSLDRRAIEQHLKTGFGEPWCSQLITHASRATSTPAKHANGRALCGR